MAVLSDRPEAKTAAASAKSSLRPLLFIRVEAGELLEASAHVGVKGLQGSQMVAGRHSPYGEDHLAERTTVPQKMESNLRIWQLPQGAQDLNSFVNSAVGIAVAEGGTTNRTTQQLCRPASL